MLRVECIYKDVDFQKIKDLWMNPPKDPNVKEYTVLEKFPNGDTAIYLRFKMPLMSDRDNVFILHHEPIEGGGIYLNVQTIERDDKPPV